MLDKIERGSTVSSRAVCVGGFDVDAWSARGMLRTQAWTEGCE